MTNGSTLSINTIYDPENANFAFSGCSEEQINTENTPIIPKDSFKIRIQHYLDRFDTPSISIYWIIMYIGYVTLTVCISVVFLYCFFLLLEITKSKIAVFFGLLFESLYVLFIYSKTLNPVFRIKNVTYQTIVIILYLILSVTLSYYFVFCSEYMLPSSINAL